MNYKIQVRRDTKSNWVSSNPTLCNGEPGFESDTNKLKIGDGTTAWATLDYLSDITYYSATRNSYIAGTNDESLVYATSTCLNVILPNAVDGAVYTTVNRLNNLSLVVSTQDAGTINGSSAISLPIEYSATFLCDGTNWTIISTGTGNSFSYSYVAKTATYTLTGSDYMVECTTNTFTVTLPTAVGLSGRLYSVKNTGTGTITLEGDGAETIDGAANKSIAQWENITVMSNGANWIIT